MLSLSSAKAGSRAARGKSEAEEAESGFEGVVCEARREVREGGRRGVVGRDVEGLRVWDGVAIVSGSCPCGVLEWSIEKLLE